MQLDNGTRWIANVPALGHRQSRDGTELHGLPEISFAGALEAATSVTPYPCRYSDILVHSGVAFRMRWFHGPDSDRWVGAHSNFSADGPTEISALRETTGWQLWVEHLPGLPDGQAGRYVPDLCISIDHQVPVLCYRRAGTHWETGVVSGYADHGRQLLVQDYGVVMGVPRRLTPDDLHPFFVFLLTYNEPPSGEEIRASILRRAVENWLRGEVPAEEAWYWSRYPSGSRYASGPGAFAAWLDSLRKARELPDAEQRALFEANWSTFAGLVSARAAAASYLAEQAEIAGGEEGELLAEVGAAYRQECLLLRTAVEQGNAFLGPWTSEHSWECWTSTVRRREMEVLQEASRLERLAMERLEEIMVRTEEAEVEYDDHV